MSDALYKKRVGISGSYGGLNLGDEAILTAIIAQLRSALPVEITVFSRDAKNTLKNHAVDHAVQARDISRHEAIQILPTDYIGEVAGALAAYCLNNNRVPRQVRGNPEYLAEFQQLLREKIGIELAWPNPRATAR